MIVMLALVSLRCLCDRFGPQMRQIDKLTSTSRAPRATWDAARMHAASLVVDIGQAKKWGREREGEGELCAARLASL